MYFSEKGSFKTNNLDEIMEVIGECPQDYSAWVNCMDSIYPVTGISEGVMEDGLVSISSADSGGSLHGMLTVKEVAGMLEEFTGDREACLEAASDIDPELDMQLDSARMISGWGIDDDFQMFFFISGDEIDYSRF